MNMRCDYCSHKRSCTKILSSKDSCRKYKLSLAFLHKFERLNIGDKIWILTDNNREEMLYNITEFEVDEIFKSRGIIFEIPNHQLNNAISKALLCRSAFLTLEEAKQEVVDRGYALNRVFTLEDQRGE